MVSPHPDLKRKIRNVYGIVNANNIQFIQRLSSSYPQDYIDLDTYNKLQRAKPWIESPKYQTLSSSPLQVIDKILVLCVDFSDQIGEYTISQINERFFSDTNNSLKSYYKEVSYSQYIPEGEVHGWYRAPNTLSYYAGDDYGKTKSPTLFKDVIDIAKNDPSIDWSSFDTNNNGYLDSIIIVHAGEEASRTKTNGLWARFIWFLIPISAGSKLMDKCAITSQYGVTGVDCHEFGHVIGLEDLYDQYGNSAGIGDYSLMGSGSWAGNPGGTTPTHFDAWSKLQLGYSTTIDNPQGLVSIHYAETNPACIKYTTTDPKEYFLIENRQKTLFDTYLPSDGLLIWHINENKSNNNDKTCLQVGLIQADNQKDIENNINNGDDGDSYPGSTNKRSFGANTTPDSSLCNGATIRNISITNISNSAQIMTFNSSSIPAKTWLTGWNIRKSKIINGANVARTYPIINITVHKGIGTDNQNTVFCDNDINSDFRDLRFTRQDGATLLRHRILSFTPNVNANVIVEIDYIPPSPENAKIYMYYSNTIASDAQTSGLALHTIKSINLNDEIPSSFYRSSGIFYDQTFTGTIPKYLDQAWVAKKGLTDYNQITSASNGIGAADIWSLYINGINIFSRHYPPAAISIINSVFDSSGEVTTFNVKCANSNCCYQWATSGAVYFVTDPVSTLGSWGLKEISCTTVTIHADKTSARIGEMISFTIGAQPLAQSYIVELIDQNNVILGRCTTSEETCTVNLDTTTLNEGVYTIKANISSSTQCTSAPVSITLQPRLLKELVILGLTGIAALGIIVTYRSKMSK